MDEHVPAPVSAHAVTDRRQRILIITRNLPPLVGGMERLNWHMAKELAKVAEVRVIGPAGAAAQAPPGVLVREAPLRPLRNFLWRARRLARREARAWRPDIVLAGSGLTAPLVRSAARVCGARTVAYLHGLDVAVRHPVYRAIWLPAIRRMDRVIANSRATLELCRGIGVDAARIGIVHPGVDLPAAPSRGTGPAQATIFPETPGPFRERHDLGDRPLLLSVGRLSSRKGLREFVAEALPLIVLARPDAVLLIVGETPGEALHAHAQTPASIKAAAEHAGVGENVLFLGKIADDELADAFGAADVHVFPVRGIPGDPEGFGMVAIEAAAHGLPTVAFATGGVVDAVAEGKSGYLIAQGDYGAFAASVVAALGCRPRLAEGARAFAAQFAWSAFGDNMATQLKVDSAHDGT